MAGLRGNIAWLLAAKQTAKGTLASPLAANAFKMPLSGGNIGPRRETDNLSETDSSRDQGVTYTTQGGVEGSPEFYVRDKPAGFWLFAALGADAPTGTMPNFTHVITPANALPYVSLWKDLGDTLYESYRDCKVGSLTVSAEAGGPLTMTAGVQGLQAVRSATAVDNALPIPVENGPVYMYSDVSGKVTLGAGVTALVSSFELTIENNLTSQQTDSFVPYDVVEGTREVSLSFDMIFETLDEYNKFHYGNAAGLTVDPSVFTTNAAFVFSKGVNNEIGFNFPKIAYEEISPEPDPGGDPVSVSVRAVAQRGASPVVTATVKNQVATY